MGKEIKQKTEIPEITAQEQEYRNIMADIFFNMFGGKRWKVKQTQQTIQGKGGPQPRLLGEGGLKTGGPFGGGGASSGF